MCGEDTRKEVGQIKARGGQKVRGITAGRGEPPLAGLGVGWRPCLGQPTRPPEGPLTGNAGCSPRHPPAAELTEPLPPPRAGEAQPAQWVRPPAPDATDSPWAWWVPHWAVGRQAGLPQGYYPPQKGRERTRPGKPSGQPSWSLPFPVPHRSWFF